MRRGIEKGPEYEYHQEEQPEQRISLREFFGNLKEKIVGSLPNSLQREDKEIKKFEENMNQSTEISKSGGEFCRFLIQKSLKNPEKEYLHVEKESSLQEYEKGYIKLLKILKNEKGDIARKHFEIAKEEILTKNEKEIQGKVEESGTEKIPELSSQIVFNKFYQDEGSNIIEELVKNYLSKELNVADSELRIKDKRTELCLDLNQLLPKDFRFVPSDLVQRRYELDRKKRETKKIPIPVDLKSYQGTKNSRGEFREESYGQDSDSGIVAYGNLTKKGGMLALMHEISHAWQSVYYQESGRGKFEEFYRKVTMDLSDIAYFRKEVSDGKLERKNFEKIVLEPLKKELKESGVEMDENIFMQKSDRLEKGKLKLTHAVTDEVFTVKSEKLNQLVTDYSREERDAWAHAIRMLRFFRKKGIDLEPHLKTLKDVKEVVESALGTYQDGLEEIIEPSTKRIRFASQVKKKKA